MEMYQYQSHGTVGLYRQTRSMRGGYLCERRPTGRLCVSEPVQRLGTLLSADLIGVVLRQQTNSCNINHRA
jgi:hypothetical protein